MIGDECFMTVKIHFNFKLISFVLSTLLMTLAILVLTQPAFAKERDLQHAQLQAFVRQLEQMQVRIADDLIRPPQKGERYYFDYQRFEEDLKRVQRGLEDYLIPKRAQPRDPLELMGNYKLQGSDWRQP